MSILNAKEMIEKFGFNETKEIILDLIGKIKKVDKPRRELNAWLLVNLGTDIFNAWTVFDEDKTNGLLTCEIVEQFIDPKVFISFVYIEPDTDCGQELLDKCEQWAESIGVKKLMFYTKRNYRGFERKYKFKLLRTVMVKELK